MIKTYNPLYLIRKHNIKRTSRNIFNCTDYKQEILFIKYYRQHKNIERFDIEIFCNIIKNYS
jgi:hypothetical protein